MGIVFGGTGVSSGRAFQTIALEGGGSTYLIPSGTWRIQLGPYTAYQEYDQVTDSWRNVGDPAGRTKYVDSDGVNFRLANTTGCVVGATVTSGGQNYTSAPTVAVNSGGAMFSAVLGPNVTSITVTNGGTNYVYPPNVIIQSPPSVASLPAVQATAKATISGGAVTAVTMIDYGAGYSAGAPTVNLVNDPRDSTGSGAAATANLANSGAVTALICTNHGTATGISTTGTLPTITFTGGGGTSAAAVPVMAWTVTGITSVTAGSGYPANVLAEGLSVASGTAQYTNPTVQSNLLLSRPALVGVTTSSGALTTGSTVYDGGINAQLPTAYVLSGATGSAGAVVFTVARPTT